MQVNDTGSSALKRSLSLPMLTLYGLGTTIGAGIYALLGEIAGVAGYGAPLSFLVASLVAGLTACSFAELSARFPRAAGAALYVQEGFGNVRVATLVGLLVVMAGLISAAALVNGFYGYLAALTGASRTVTILLACIVLSSLAAWGIRQSVTVAAVITVIEIGGLLVVVFSGIDRFAELPDQWHLFVPDASMGAAIPVLLGVTLAFYAFIGFEDMVDVAEEVRDVQRTLPMAILLTLGISTLLYITLAMSALLAASPRELAASGAPLAMLFELNTGRSSVGIGIVAMFAIVNGALVQIVMVSRVLYGLASRGQLPGFLAVVNPVTQTPVAATVVGGAVLLALALYGRLAGLATVTSVVTLCIFTTVNFALLRIKRREPDAGVICFPTWVPALGMLLSFVFVVLGVSGFRA